MKIRIVLLVLIASSEYAHRPVDGSNYFVAPSHSSVETVTSGHKNWGQSGMRERQGDRVFVEMAEDQKPPLGIYEVRLARTSKD